MGFPWPRLVSTQNISRLSRVSGLHTGKEGKYRTGFRLTCYLPAVGRRWLFPFFLGSERGRHGVRSAESGWNPDGAFEVYLDMVSIQLASGLLGLVSFRFAQRSADVDPGWKLKS